MIAPVRARAVTLHPRPTAVVLLLVTIGSLFALRRFEIDPDVAAQFPEENEVELLQHTVVGEEASRTLFLFLRGPDLEQRLETLLPELEASLVGTLACFLASVILVPVALRRHAHA